MTFKKRATKSIALALVGVTVITPMLNTVFAMEVNKNQKEIALNSLEEMFSIDEIIAYARYNGAKNNEIESLLELRNTQFYNTIELKERGIASTTIKIAAKFIKNNASKIAGILKKYFRVNISSKSIMTAVDVIFDISGSIDDFLYNFVDYICDTFSIRCPESNKKLVARALRLIIPF